MDSKAEIMERLATLSSQEILHLLRDETLFEVAARYFEAIGVNQQPIRIETQTFLGGPSASATAALAKPASPNRAKRPLNAFMAFRSYYLKLFPDVQQKTASGFLTALWHKDLFRNKWTLIAKVYSFVRDEIGRDNISLSLFLGLSCPIMKITEPSVYLERFGWSVKEDENGSPKLSRDENAPKKTESDFEMEDYPSTENELLSSVINHGYLPDQGANLMERLNANSNSIMTTVSGSLPIQYSPEKRDFIKTVQSDPIQASKELFGSEFCEQTIRALGVNSHNVNSLNLINHLPMQIDYPDPRKFYHYAGPHSQISLSGAPVMRLNNLSESQSFDIDSPWDVDEILGHTQQEGERTISPQRNPLYNARSDFHYPF